MIYESATKKIYYLRPVGQEGPIKVGCSRMVEERLRAFMNWSPLPLEIVCVVEGGHDVERALHRRYWKTRLHSEWFYPSDQMMSDIERIQKGNPLSDIIGDAKEINLRKKVEWKEMKADKRYKPAFYPSDKQRYGGATEIK